jgi:hypothetical protein
LLAEFFSKKLPVTTYVFCVADPDSHGSVQSDKLLDPDPDPHQSDKLDPDPDLHQFADSKLKCMEYEPTVYE